MKKHFKRTVAMLLAVVMILAMLPAAVFAAAGETFAITPLEGLPDDNQAVVIFSASGGGVFAGTASGGSVGIVGANGLEEGTLSVGEGAGVYKLQKNSDGTYYIMCGGKYLFTDSNEQLAMKDTAEKGTKWKIKAVSGTDYNGFSICNNDFKYNGSRDIYIEYYSSFKCWTTTAMSAIFAFNFYTIDESAADPDGDGYIGTKPTSGPLPEDGKTYVIYNDYGGVCFGPQSADTTSPSIEGIPSSLDGDSLNIGNGSYIFKVHKSGNYYAFEHNGKYLRTSENYTENGKTNNAETLYFDTLNNDYSYWTLNETLGGWMLTNKTAKYGSNYVSVEFFSNSFSGWTFNGSYNLFAMRFFEVEDTYNLGYVLNPAITISAESAFVGVDYEFKLSLDDLTRVTDLTVTYKTDGEETKLEPKSVDGQKYVFSVPDSALQGKKTLTLKGVAKNEYGMEYSKEVTVDILDEPLIVSVSPMSNEATGNEKRPTISATIANCGNNPKVSMQIDGTDVTPTVTATSVSYKPTANMTDDRHTVALTVTRADNKKAEMTWSFFVGEAGMSLYFGQIHSHTAEYSDGAGQLEDAYEHAMLADDVDYLIVTDHSNYFDSTSSNSTASYYDLEKLTKSGSITKWEEARATAAEYNAKRDDFVAAYGYEMTWSGGPGHTNSFNTYGTVSRNNSELNNKTGYAGMHRYNDLMTNANRGLDIDGNPVAEGVKTKYIDDAPVVSQFNHPGTTFGTFDEFAGYTPLRDTVLCLIEVGNGEGKVGGSSYWPSYSEYDKALAKGWHIAPTNNQDNHKGKWGDSNTCRDVILTDDFTEAGLYRAMSERRVYSTEDQNLRIYYYLNDEIMGTIIDTGDEDVKQVKIVASISDPDKSDKISKVEIIGENGITLKKFDAAGSTYELNTTISNTDAYYYIKVTEADGDIAVTAPVWVGVATPITAAISSNAALSIAGEAEKITAKVDNSAEADYNLTKVTFTLTDSKGKETKVKTFDEAAIIAAGESKVFEWDYTRALSDPSLKKEEQTLTVVFSGTYNGKSFKCQANVKQTVYNPSALVKIAIDYGHGNFYVSGGYSDNMGNFIQYCADNGVSAEFIQKGEFTYDTLKKYAMVVLTVPFDSGNLTPSVYTEEELEAIAKYAQKGGNIIVCTKSDRNSPIVPNALNCASITNSILEAIGSNVRAANGIIVDNDMKSNEAYRIYFSALENFNTEHRFTKGAYTASNAFGTKPAPDNSTGFQLYNAAPILINEGAEKKVETLVKGYQSTWGASYTDNFTGSAYVPQYSDDGSADTVTAKIGEVNIMTYEKLSGGGWLITSGCTFFSNYDIKDDIEYANKYIVQNILRELTNADSGMVVSAIKDVKKVTVPSTENKKEYTIEGYVTSNASAYDQDTAFFDCIYMQDRQGNGINVFPVAGHYAIGMNVRAHGGVTYYCGEVELNTSTDYGGYCRVISDDTYKIEPKKVDCKTAMSDAQIGNLLQIEGLVTGIHKTEGVIDKIYVRDNSGEACLFINGYIMKDYTGLDTLKIGNIVSGVGIGSRDVDEQSATSAIFSRLRVRNRAEIKILDDKVHGDQLFTDVKTTDWFYDYVLDVVERGLILGTSTSTFSPNATLTRGMVATILYRMVGEPKVDSRASFKDVNGDEWFADPVAWAEATGVVNGYSDGTFLPNANVSRQEMAVMLARFAQLVKGMEITAEGDLSAFPDGNTVPDWSREAIIWAVDNGIINGLDGKIAPTGNATRAQFAAIIIRFLELAKEPEVTE